MSRTEQSHHSIMAKRESLPPLSCTHDASLLGRPMCCMSLLSLAYGSDGDLDVLLGNALYTNNGDSTFTFVTEKAFLGAGDAGRGFSKETIATQINGDPITSGCNFGVLCAALNTTGARACTARVSALRAPALEVGTHKLQGRECFTSH